MVVGRRIRGEGEPVLGRRIPQLVADDPGLHASSPSAGIELDDVVHVLGEVEHYRHVDALTGQAGPAAPGQDGGLVATAACQRGEHVVRVLGDDDADGYLTVDGCVVGVQVPAALVEPDLASDHRGQVTSQPGPVEPVEALVLRGATPGSGRIQNHCHRALSHHTAHRDPRIAPTYRPSIAHLDIYRCPIYLDGTPGSPGPNAIGAGSSPGRRTRPIWATLPGDRVEPSPAARRRSGGPRQSFVGRGVGYVHR